MLPNHNAAAFTEKEIEGTLAERFERMVAQHPSRLAVKASDRTLDYATLDCIANSLACSIGNQSVTLESPVAILFDHLSSVIAAMLGVLKSGRAYLALDPSHPPERLRRLLEDSHARCLVTNSQHLATAETLAQDDLVLINLDDLAETEPVEDTGRSLSSDSVAGIFYTSGSTGQPKGVARSHRQILQRVRMEHIIDGIGPNDRIALLYSCSYGASTTDIFNALLTGATLCLYDVNKSGLTMLAQWLINEKISFLHLPAMLFRQFASMLSETDQFPDIRQVTPSGRLFRSDVEAFRRFFPAEAVMVSRMAATETGIITRLLIDRSMCIDTEVLPVGYPVEGKKIILLDEAGASVEPGQTGQIVVRSRYLAPGYWHKGGVTQELFESDVSCANERTYCTGDLGRLMPDGCLEYLGRQDDQVKIRGYRIELSEIEAALHDLAAVKQVVVVAHKPAQDEPFLVAYVSPTAKSDCSISDLRTALGNTLPDFMIPVQFVILEHLPLSPNGKIDYQALPPPERTRPYLSTSYRAPQSDTEKMLAQIWLEVLDLDRVGIDDSFLDLGGHSLLATQIAVRVLDTFQVELSPQMLLQAATVSYMASQIEAFQQGNEKIGLTEPMTKSDQHEAVLSPQKQVLLDRKLKEKSRSNGVRNSSRIPSRVKSEHLPLSFAQQRLWFLEQLEPGRPTYNVRRAVRLKGELHIAALERSFNEIIRRHEILRTTFVRLDEKPIQVIAPSLALEIPILDLSELPADEREDELQKRISDESLRPFDIENGPLIRVLLMRLAADESVLLISKHHIISDGWSSGIMNEELSKLYEANVSGQPASLATLPVQYADFTVWQRNWLQGDVLDEQLSYWKQQLVDLPGLDLPTDHPRPPVQSNQGASHAFTLPAPLLRAIKALSQEHGVTLFMTLLAAFQVLLSRYSGQTDIAIGTPIAGRNRVELEGIIGFFANTLVLRGDLSGNPNFSELLVRIRGMALDAYAHQDVPFEKLVEELTPTRDMSRNPLFQVMFVMQNTRGRLLELTGLCSSQIGSENKTARFDLDLSMHERAQELIGTLNYSTDLFEAATIERLALHFTTLLEAIAADPCQRLSEVDLLTHVERHQLLVEWNDTQAEYPSDACMHQLFEEQVARTPDAIALVFENEQVTYLELNRRANQLAHYLCAQGIRPGVMVGLCVERSLEMVVGILGILKAGAAYLPLDPNYPETRLHFILQDSKVSVVLSKQGLASLLTDYKLRIIYMDTNWPAIEKNSEQNLVSLARGDSLAYVIYTSGSTGRPKGTLLEHRGLCKVSTEQVRQFGAGVGSRVLQFASPNFDASLFELTMALTTGGALVLARPEELHPGLPLSKLLCDQRITILTIPPSSLSLLSPTSFPDLMIINVAGEPCPAELVDRWARGRHFFNLYGPTECSIWSTATECKGGGSAPHIGRPIGNTQAYIMDRHGQPAPIGIAGEIHIGGVGVSRGYLNRPELTAEKFIPNPFSEDPESRLYKTGDLAKYHPDGNIEYLGRIDHQVKLRGFRIELGEIEVVLGQCGHVENCVVTLREDNPGDKRLVGYVVVEKNHLLVISDLRDYLKESLPDYMIPSAFVLLDELPLTPNGKVDRRALPKPDQASLGINTAFIAPKTPAEVAISGVWREVLGVDQVGLHDNFFTLGGHSLLATQLVSRINNSLNVRLPLRYLFEYPTVAELANKVVRAENGQSVVGATNKSLNPIPRLPRNNAKRVQNKHS